MKAYDASAEINASPEAVWAVLTDASRYPEWDTGLERMEGEIAAGSRLRISSKLSPGRAFPVTVSELAPPRRMVWRSGMPLGLFKGERVFNLEPGENGSTRFTMREAFTGPLAPVMGRMIPDMGPTFEQFALDLKARAEGSGG